MCDQEKISLIKQAFQIKHNPIIHYLPKDIDIQQILQSYRAFQKKEETNLLTPQKIKVRQQTPLMKMKRVILNSYNKSHRYNSVKPSRNNINEKSFLLIKNLSISTSTQPNSPKSFKFTPKSRLQSLERSKERSQTNKVKSDWRSFEFSDEISAWTRKTSESV